MTSAVVTGDTIGSVQLDQLSEYLYVLPTGVLRNSGTTVSATGAVTTIVNEGSILEANQGLSGGAVGVAVSMIANAPLLTNFGRIISASGNAIEAGGTLGAATIVNHGSVSGGNNGIRLANSADILNTGTIWARSVAITVDSLAVLSLANSGTIETGPGRSAIVGGIFGDTIVNTGSILGTILLNGGDDLYDGRDGRLSGPVAGGDGNNTIWGGAGAETLNGGDDDDEIAGFAGNDIITGGTGFDMLDGGDGFDLVSYAFALGPVLVNLTDDQLNTGDAADDALYGFEGVIGSPYGDTLIGAAGANDLRGIAGNDSLDGRAGADTMRGGGGDDIMRVDNARDLIIETAGGGADTVIATVSYRLAAGAQVEVLMTGNAAGTGALNLTGSGSANVITGNAGVNRLDGGAGDDTLSGLVGADTLNGGRGADSLSGDAGADLLHGGEGNDILNGAEGTDTLNGGGGVFDQLRGGAGNDVFVFNMPLGAGNAGILDFGAGDTIRLSQAVFAALPTGVLADGAIAFGSANVVETTRIIVEKAGGLDQTQVFYYDPDGSGVSSRVVFGSLQGGIGLADLTAADFTVIA